MAVTQSSVLNYRDWNYKYIFYFNCLRLFWRVSLVRGVWLTQHASRQRPCPLALSPSDDSTDSSRRDFNSSFGGVFTQHSLLGRASAHRTTGEAGGRPRGLCSHGPRRLPPAICRPGSEPEASPSPFLFPTRRLGGRSRWHLSPVTALRSLVSSVMVNLGARVWCGARAGRTREDRESGAAPPRSGPRQLRGLSRKPGGVTSEKRWPLGASLFCKPAAGPLRPT